MTMTSDKLSAVRLHWRGMRLLSKYMPRFFTIITAHTVITAVTPFVTLWMAGRIIDLLAASSSVETVITWVVAALSAEAVLALTGGICKRIKEAMWEQLYRTVERVLTDKLFELDHADIDDPHTTALLSHVRENTAALGAGLVRIPDIYQRLVMGAVGVTAAVVTASGLVLSRTAVSEGMGAVVDHPLTVVALMVLLVVTTTLSLLFSRRADRLSRSDTETVVKWDRHYYAFYNEMFDHTKAADVRLYRQDALIEKHLKAVEQTYFSKGGIKHRRGLGTGGILQSCSAALAAVWMMAAVAFVAAKAYAAAFGIGAAVYYVGVLLCAANRIDDVCRSGCETVDNAPYLQTTFAFLDIVPQMYRGSLTTEKRADRDYELEFRGVSFRYPAQERYALCDVSLRLTPGQRVAIVGENGSGKSTFIKLLCRLYDPEKGEILLNGIDIRKYRYSEYMALIAVVFQDFQLLAQPLGNNVAGATDYDRERVLRCLESVGFDAHLREWSHGLETPLSRELDADGVTVSVADAQKIAIARALYTDAPLVALDEPTAALDPIAEAELYEDLDAIASDRTVIYVSHRLSGCRLCDEILVFDKGHIVQRGTHEALLADVDGKYYELWNAQAQYYNSC